MEQVFAGMRENMKPTLAKMLPPGEYQDKLIPLFFEKFQTKLKTDELLDLIVEIRRLLLCLEIIRLGPGLLDRGLDLGRAHLLLLAALPTSNIRMSGRQVSCLCCGARWDSR